MQSRTLLIEYTQRFRDAWGLSQSHVAGLGARPGALLLRCPIPASPLPPAALQVRHALACSPNRSRGAGGHSGRRMCKLAGHRCGRWQERAHAGPSEWGWGAGALLFQGLISPLPLQTVKHTAFCGHRGLFQLFISTQSTHLQSLYIWSCPFPKGPANTGPPRRHCWLGQGPTALVQLICQPLLSGSIHFANGTWSPCILGEPEGNPCSISERVL